MTLDCLAYHQVLGRPHDGPLQMEKGMRNSGQLRLKKLPVESFVICGYSKFQRAEKIWGLPVITILDERQVRL